MECELKDVTVDYDGRIALKHINCTLHQGKWISVIGPTGAGKSTFVKVLKGLVPSFQGEYRIDGQNVQVDARGKMKVVPEIGFVFQYPEHQIFETTVYKELAFAPKIQGFSAQQIDEAIEHILPQLGLSKELLTYAPFELSGGQRRRIAIASVLLMNPKLLILDEPTAGLDPLSRASMLKMLKEWQQADNRTVLFVSHHMDDVAEYSDEVMVFSEGQLIGHDEANTIFLKKTELLQKARIPLPEHLQFLQLMEQLCGYPIEVESCKERDVFSTLLPIWHARSFMNGK